MKSTWTSLGEGHCCEFAFAAHREAVSTMNVTHRRRRLNSPAVELLLHARAAFSNWAMFGRQQSLCASFHHQGRPDRVDRRAVPPPLGFMPCRPVTLRRRLSATLPFVESVARLWRKPIRHRVNWITASQACAFASAQHRARCMTRWTARRARLPRRAYVSCREHRIPVARTARRKSVSCDLCQRVSAGSAVLSQERCSTRDLMLENIGRGVGVSPRLSLVGGSF